MSVNDDIKNSIKHLADRGDSIYSIPCTVKSVDLTNKTCDCEPINGDADLLDVRLITQSTTGFLIIPSINSLVVVTMMNKYTGYVAMFSDIDEIQLNGDNEDGIVKVNDLVTKLNNLENAFNQHLLAYNLHTHAGVTVGAGVTGITTPDTQTLTPTQKIELENQKVKHGS